VQETNPDVVVNSRTFYKKLTVTVTQRFLKSPVVLNNVFGYREN
jgi:hypothetical protein